MSICADGPSKFATNCAMYLQCVCPTEKESLRVGQGHSILPPSTGFSVRVPEVGLLCQSKDCLEMMMIDMVHCCMHASNQSITLINNSFNIINSEI